ncbi:MAG: hypothetical protein GX776_05575 [Oxalobacter sp.]|nr:hypothetical protein [Oxalobacter sp.]
MDTVSQQNAALIEEAAAAESLQQQAKTLVHAMSTFKTETDFTNAPAEKIFRSNSTSSKRGKKLPIRLPGYIKNEADRVPALTAARHISTETYEEKMEEF